MTIDAPWGEVLAVLGEDRPDDLAVRYLTDPHTVGTTLTRAELLHGARAAAAHLTRHGARGERVLVVARSRRGFLEWFLGCLLAGATAVPCPPPRGRDRAARTETLVRDGRIRFMVGAAPDRSALPDGVTWIGELDHLDVEPLAPTDRSPAAVPAVLQYTSGSTRAPRAVMLTARGLLANVADIAAGFGLTGDDSILVWLPPFHDMGLIGGLLTPVLTGIPVTVMPPNVFAQRPVGWLEAVSTWKATVSGGPTTAYEAVARQLVQGPVTGLDLSAWRVAFVGAEPVVATALERFAEGTARHHFRAEAFSPCYGLAEATLLVTCMSGVRQGHGHDEAAGVRCGSPAGGSRVRVVRAGTECERGEVGEIWVAGPGVAGGYWNDAEATRETFGARLPGSDTTYLRTGDLGFLDKDGALVPTGRVKDLIIVDGRNIVPSDLELVACRAAEAAGVGAAAAFQLTGDQDEVAGRVAGRFGVLVEVNDAGTVPDSVLETIVDAVVAEAGTIPAVVALVRPGRLDRTTSGKVRRAVVRRRFQSGELVPERMWDELSAARSEAGAAGRAREQVLMAPPAERPRSVVRQVDALLARLGAVGGAGLLSDRMNSLDQLVLVHQLELLAGASVDRRRVREARSADDLARLVTQVWREPDGGSAVSQVAALGERAPTGAGESVMYLWESVVPGSTVLTAGAEVVSGWSVPRLRAAARVLVERHEALRTSYHSTGQGLRRVVLAAHDVAPWLVEADGRGWSASEVDLWVAQEARRPFDLDRPPLLRLSCLTTGADSGVVVIAVPHVAADFRSLTLLLDDLSRHLGGLALPPAPRTYREHLGEDHARLQEPLMAAAGERLGRRHATSAKLALPGRRRGGRPQGGSAAEVPVRLLGPEELVLVDQLARDHGTTRFCVLLALWQATLHRVTGQREVTVGSPFHGRRAGFLDTVGLFMNHVPLLSTVTEQTSFGDLVGRTAHEVDQAHDDQWVPLSQWWEGARRTGARDTAPFESLFVMHQTVRGEPLGLATFELRDGVELAVGDGVWRSRRVPHAADTVPLTVMAGADADGVSAVLRAVQDVLSADDLGRVADEFVTGARALLTDPRLPVLPGAVPARPAQDARTDHFLDPLREQAVGRPHDVAVTDRDRSLTFAEFWVEVERAAGGLLALGVVPGDVVAIGLPRSVDAVVATFAVLRADATYLHLDLSSPVERLSRLCGVARATLCIGEHAQGEQQGQANTGTAAFGEAGPNVRQVTLADLRETATGPGASAPGLGELPAYISFTSGSNGFPKPVAVPRDAVTVAVRAFGDELGMGPGDVVCCVSPLGWDIAVGDIVAAPLRGATLVLVDDTVARDGTELGRVLDASRATLMTTTPTRWQMVVDAGWRPPPGFRAGSGGDALSERTAADLAHRGVDLWNFYGPTETVLFATAADLRTWAPSGPVPLGEPMSDYTVHVSAATGDIGEILVGGPAVAHGYLGDPRATASAFVPDPDGSTPGARVYRTGDLGRMADGELLFVGRADHQVKIRGMRIEAGEVEQVLLTLEDVQQALVGAVGSGADKELAALVVLRPTGTRQVHELVAELGRLLPSPMVPTRLSVVDTLPTSSYGKLDRSVLDQIDRVGPAQEPTGSTPSSMTSRVAEIMAGVLDLPRVGAHDDFFALGGHSVSALVLASRVTEVTGRQLPVRAVFEGPTPAELATWSGPDDPGEAPAAATTGRVPLTPGQRSLWLEALRSGSSDGMVLPYLVEIENAPDAAVLRRAFDDLVDRHESLRTRVVTDSDGLPYQDLGAAPRLHVVDARTTEEDLVEAGRADLLRRLRSDWALDGPLVSVAVHVSGSRAVLGMAVHHLVSDGWSARVLLEDFVLLCGAASRETAPPAASGPTAHDVARTLTTSPTAVERCAQRLHGALPVLPGARDGSAGGGRRLRQPVGSAPYTLARRWSVTPYAVTVAAVLRSLERLTGRSDLMVGIDVAGREPKTERVVGYLGSQAPLRLDLSEDGGLEGAARAVAAELRDLAAGGTVGWDEVVAQARRADPGFVDPVDVKIAHQFVPREISGADGLTVRRHDPRWASTAFPLALWLWDSGREMDLEVHWRSDACRAAWVAKLADHAAQILRDEAATPDEELQSEEELKESAGMALDFWDDGIDAVPLVRTGPSGDAATPGTIELRQGGTTVPVVHGDGGTAQAWLAEEPVRWRGLLDEHGAILLRGFHVDTPEQLSAATKHIFDAPYSTREHTRAVLGDEVVLPIEYPAALDLFWHNEDSFNLTWPETITFACAVPAATGGATTVVDGRAVLAALEPDVRERFSTLGVQYTRRFVPGLGLPWQTVFGTDDIDEVRARCSAEGSSLHQVDGVMETRARRPAVHTDRSGLPVWFAQVLHWHERCLSPEVRQDIERTGVPFPRAVTYGDGTSIPDDVVDAVIEASRASDVAVPWQAGDLLIVDNSRSAHGRRAYTGERRIMVSLGDPRTSPADAG